MTISMSNKEAEASAFTVTTREQPQPKHDRRMAALGEGKSIKGILSTNPKLQMTTKGRKHIIFEVKLVDEQARKEVSLWDDPAVAFHEDIKFMRITGQNPLIVEFEGRYRKKDAFHGDLNIKSEIWTFNAKSHIVDWNSPAGKMQHAATLKMNVERCETKTQESTNRRYFAVTGISQGRRRSIKLNGDEAPMTAQKLIKASPEQPIPFEFDGVYQMREINGAFRKIFTAKREAAARALEVSTPRQTLGINQANPAEKSRQVAHQAL